MNVKHFNPDIRLGQLIKHYWLMEIDSGKKPIEELLFPVGAIEIIFHLQTPFLRLSNDTWTPERKAFIEGQQSGILRVKQKGVMKTIGITFYPWATTVLYNTPPISFTDTNFDIYALDNSIHQLNEKLQNNTDNNLIPVLCDSYFISFLKNKFQNHNSTGLAIITAFKHPNEHFTVSEIKKDWNFSSKLFEKKFKELIGVSAGELLKKRRMNNVLKKTLHYEYKSLTDVAYKAGYYDQSHFIKDFKTYFHASPKILKKEHPLLKHFI